MLRPCWDCPSCTCAHTEAVRCIIGGTEDDFKRTEKNGLIGVDEIDKNGDGVLDVGELGPIWSIKIKSERFFGFLSPMCKLTLGPAVLERLGIPRISRTSASYKVSGLLWIQLPRDCKTLASEHGKWSSSWRPTT